MYNSNYFNISRNGDRMTFEQIVTYIIVPAIAGVTAIWGMVKYIVPRIVQARLEGDKDTREYSQKKDQLEQMSRLSDSAAAHQVVAELLANSQDKEERANEFVRTMFFNAVDQIKTNTVHIPGLITEIREFGKEVNKRITGLETRQRMLINLITGGKLPEEDEPTDDYEAWRKRKLGEAIIQPPINSDKARGSDDQ